MHEAGAVALVTHAKSILCDTGFEQVWLFGCGDENCFLKEMKEKIVHLILSWVKLSPGIKLQAIIIQPLQELF